ncbi:MAG TPA: hypothetical protein VHO24_17130 [Opitutaceae bacterium]|nr:hypothetical protein [Opitutaceae bacterium]
MNPSTSSNAEPAREATAFKVSTRQLAPDLGAAGAEHDPRDLGQLGASQLNSLLEKLVTFTPDKLVDADPHLVVSGRRGRFLVRPSRGKVRLFDATDATRDPLEITAPEVADYLDGCELKPVAEAAEAAGVPDATNTRMGLVIALLVLSTTMVGASAYFTFRPATIDADVRYSEVTPGAQLVSFQQQFTGTFATGTGDGSRMLIFSAGKLVRFVEHGPNHVVVDERNDTYQIALRENTPVARTIHLGPIDLRDAKTLFYAGETYTRQP